MDKDTKPNQRIATLNPAFADTCGTVDKLFIERQLLTVDVAVPFTGIFKDGILTQVKGYSEGKKADIPMKLTWEYIPDGNKGWKFVRKLQQELSKPLNIHLSIKKEPGFDYRIHNKQNVVISRLLVDLRDIDEAIDLLIKEANRFYILYCKSL
jgi:hypothetical protein